VAPIRNEAARLTNPGQAFEPAPRPRELAAEPAGLRILRRIPAQTDPPRLVTVRNFQVRMHRARLGLSRCVGGLDRGAPANPDAMFSSSSRTLPCRPSTVPSVVNTRDDGRARRDHRLSRNRTSARRSASVKEEAPACSFKTSISRAARLS
jgi:hypothetical protein